MIGILGVILMNCFVIQATVNDTYKITHVAWFEIESKGLKYAWQDYQGRFSIALFGKTAPTTVNNFVGLTKGYEVKNKLLHYKGTPIHRIVKDFVIQMGDVTNFDGTGGESIFGHRFNDEAFTLSHRGPGWVSMANYGPDTNKSQFIILLIKAKWLDGKHVVFGKVIKGFDVIRTISDFETLPDTATPIRNITIVDCGVDTLDEPVNLEESQLDSLKDLEI